MILWQKWQSEERAHVSTSKSVSFFIFSGLSLMGSMNVVSSTATSVEDNLKEKNYPLPVLTQVSREREGGTSLAGWLPLGYSSYKRFIGKKLSENKFTKKSESFCFDTSFTGEGGTSLAGWLSVGDARKVDWSHERHVEADRAIVVMH